VAERKLFHAIDSESVSAVANLFGVGATVEPYTPDGSPVYRVEPGGAADGIRMVLWPSLSRVDVTSAGDHAWVLKEVATVEVIQGVEVVFRPAEFKGFLFVSVNGWVNMVVG
jgi:hypothetical protein